jgi:trans-aconitate 2-methyltransferase
MTERAREWDAATYDRVSDPQTRWGAAVLGRLELRGDERVLDAGCGSGRVTELLLERLPKGSVVALDGSERMVDEARRRLARLGDRVEFVRADLMNPLPIDVPVDAVLSTATFHWVRDHAVLFANLAAVMRPDGHLVAQCGGAGNLASVVDALRSIGAPGFEGKAFATAEETRHRLLSAGFRNAETWLHPEPTLFDSREDLETFLATVVLREHVDRMDAPTRSAFLAAVIDRLPTLELDYVRLNIDATRA